MADNITLETFAEIMRHVESPEHIWKELADFTQDVGIDALCYYHVAPPGSQDFSEKYFTSIGFNQEAADEHVHRVSLAAYLAHVQFCNLKAKNAEESVHLTSREKEVLTWVARGKSNSVIADIVGISQHTVNGYLRRIYLKTRTTDRTSAALRAIGDSLIDF